MEAAAIFQRTDDGRDEIRTKKHGLTQSERLVLIILDGVTPYGELRERLKGLSEERFERALNKLLSKKLIIEVMFQLEDQKPEKLDASVVDRFLQQDPADPVTIISLDPSNEFDGEELSMDALRNSNTDGLRSNTSPYSENMEPHPSQFLEAIQLPVGPVKEVDFYLPLEKPALKSTAVPIAKDGPGPETSLSPVPVADEMAQDDWASPIPSKRMPKWGYAGIIAGLIVIVALVIALRGH